MTWTDDEVGVLMDLAAALTSIVTLLACVVAGWQWSLIVPAGLVVRALVTASRTDRQPPASSSEAKGGYTPVAPGTTKRPDLVTHHEET